MKLPKPNPESYNSAKPFPHLVIDNVFDIQDLQWIVDEWPVTHEGYDENSKKGYTNTEIAMGAYIADFIKIHFQSQRFIYFLEDLTGIKGLVMDWRGGPSLHETFPGGSLIPHLDYTLHNVTGLQHRVNAILFLNDWKDYGGDLELFEENRAYGGKVINSVVRIPPVFNRIAIFNIDERAWHGCPSVLSCPEGMSRKSIALNYFSAPQIAKGISTKFYKEPWLRKFLGKKIPGNP